MNKIQDYVINLNSFVVRAKTEAEAEKYAKEILSSVKQLSIESIEVL